jgi:hypothetical protein
VRSGETKLVAEGVDQQQARLRLECAGFPVDVEADGDGAAHALLLVGRTGATLLLRAYAVKLESDQNVVVRL